MKQDEVTIELTCAEAEWLRGYLSDRNVGNGASIREKIPLTGFRIGDRFRQEEGFFAGHEYILARTDKNRVGLIDLSDGNHWDDPVEVDSVYSITLREFEEVTNYCEFTKI